MLYFVFTRSLLAHTLQHLRNTTAGLYNSYIFHAMVCLSVLQNVTNIMLTLIMQIREFVAWLYISVLVICFGHSALLLFTHLLVIIMSHHPDTHLFAVFVQCMSTHVHRFTDGWL